MCTSMQGCRTDGYFKHLSSFGLNDFSRPFACISFVKFMRIHSKLLYLDSKNTDK